MEIVMADTSADGAFDVAEYMVYKKALQTTGKLGLIDIGFHTADADGNGRLTSLEWGPFSAKLNGMPFGPFDIDKDDAVTLSEVLAVLRVLAQPPSD